MIGISSCGIYTFDDTNALIVKNISSTPGLTGSCIKLIDSHNVKVYGFDHWLIDAMVGVPLLESMW